MAHITIKHAKPVPLPIEKITLELTHREAIFLRLVMGRLTRAHLDEIRAQHINSPFGERKHPDDLATLDTSNINSIYNALQVHDSKLLTNTKSAF